MFGFGFGVRDKVLGYENNERLTNPQSVDWNLVGLDSGLELGLGRGSRLGIGLGIGIRLSKQGGANPLLVNRNLIGWPSFVTVKTH